MSKTKFCQGISDISDTYMGFIVDLWGVLHDGENAYDGATDCLKELKARKKFIILLTNSEDRAENVKARLKKMGIGPSLYDAIVTSGEMIWQGLSDQNQGLFTRLGKKCYLFGGKGGEAMLEGTGVTLVRDVNEADFLMITSGANAMGDYEPVLRTAVRRGLKALCANPDSKALLSATFVMGPGLIARRYEDFGGVVHYIGKPHQPIFQHCIRMMQPKDIYASQIVMVGDTMAHDMLGGWASGLDTCLVSTGLHAASFRHCTTPGEVDKALNVLIAQYHNVKPNYLMGRLRWGKALPDRKHRKKHTGGPVTDRNGRVRKIRGKR